MTHTVGRLINASGARFSFRLPRYQETSLGAHAMTSNVTYTVTVLLDVNPMQDIDDRAESRTYIVADRDSGKAVIIDAVIDNVERDLRTIKELSLILTFALETHIHADHITGASMIKDRTGAKIVYGA